MFLTKRLPGLFRQCLVQRFAATNFHTSAAFMKTADMKRAKEGQSQATKNIYFRAITGNRTGSVKQRQIWVKFIGDEISSEPYKLNGFKEDKSQITNEFRIPVPEKLGPVRVLEMYRAKDWTSGSWFINVIELHYKDMTGEIQVFPVLRWINHTPGKVYSFIENDVSLPQNDQFPDQREEELDEMRTIYEYKSSMNNALVQVHELPKDEKFSTPYFLHFLTTKVDLLASSKKIEWTNRKFKNLDDLRGIYERTLGEPESMFYSDNDTYFAQMRLQGPNPRSIELCKMVPSNFAVTDEMCSPHMEGNTLNDAIAARRLFIVDLKIVDGIHHMPNCELCVPMALFYQDKSGSLQPVAIQLHQKPKDDNPVFTPSDPKYTWDVAKMFFNNADSSYHQSCVHLGLTHFNLERICVATNRCLNLSHPIYKMMAPHFLFLLAINTRGLVKLVGEGGWVDKTMTVQNKGMFQLIARCLMDFDFTRDGYFPNELKKRGVFDKELLPTYYYRDDGLALFEILRNYVAEYVNHYYPTEEDIILDTELQLWRYELTTPGEVGGCGCKGVPGDDTYGFVKQDEIIDFCTSVIFIGSALHAAANFLQYEYYGFPPTYPAMLVGETPRTNAAMTEDDMMKYIPSMSAVLDTMVISKLLSLRATNSLGDFEIQYVYDPPAVAIQSRWRVAMQQLSEQIQLQNRTRPLPYPFLDPSQVPNAISI